MIDVAGDLQPPGGGIYARWRINVVAHKEGVIGCDGAVEVLHGGFELRWPRREQDQVRLFRVLHQGPPRNDGIRFDRSRRPLRSSRGLLWGGGPLPSPCGALAVAHSCSGTEH